MTFIINYLHAFKIFLMNLTRNMDQRKKLDIFFVNFIYFSNKRLPLKDEHTVPT